jgi:pimeloyl-ACP methyl ester carboxylesterase
MTDINTANREGATLETAPTRYVEGNGIRFAYRQLGLSTRTPLVLPQHFSGNIDAWDPAVVRALATDRPVIAFDNAGVGRSPRQTPDNVAAMARDALIFINLLHLSEVDLLGFSLGGCVTQQIAAENSRLVRKLILVCAVTVPSHLLPEFCAWVGNHSPTSLRTPLMPGMIESAASNGTRTRSSG